MAFGLGWDPQGSVLAVVVLIIAGTAAFSALGLLMAGTLRAEATLAAANLVYLLLLVSGGIAVPFDKFPAGARPFLELLPAGALSEGLREVLRGGAGLPGGTSGCSSSGQRRRGALAARTFRWE